MRLQSTTNRKGERLADTDKNTCKKEIITLYTHFYVNTFKKWNVIITQVHNYITHKEINMVFN